MLLKLFLLTQKQSSLASSLSSLSLSLCISGSLSFEDFLNLLIICQWQTLWRSFVLWKAILSLDQFHWAITTYSVATNWNCSLSFPLSLRLSTGILMRLWRVVPLSESIFSSILWLLSVLFTSLCQLFLTPTSGSCDQRVLFPIKERLMVTKMLFSAVLRVGSMRIFLLRS